MLPNKHSSWTFANLRPHLLDREPPSTSPLHRTIPDLAPSLHINLFNTLKNASLKMLLPSIITTGLLTSTVTPVVVPSPAATAPPPRTPLDPLLKEDTISSPYAWEHLDSCNWHTGISPSTFICGRPLVCVTNNDDAVACTVSQDPPRSSHTTCSELESNHRENDGSTALTGERASIFWTVSMMRSMIACDSTDTVMSLFDRPAYIAAKSTSSEMASSEPTSGQTTFGKPVTSKSTSSSTSSSSPVSSTSSTSTKPTISSTTASMSSSSQEPTPSTGASASSIKTSLSSTTLSSSSSATTSSSISSDISSDVTTMTSPDSTTFSTEAAPTSTQSSTAPVIISQTSTITQTTTSTPAPTYSLGVPINPPAADTASLSTAAKAGIGAGAGAVLLLLLTAVALVLLRKRRARDEPVQHNTWPMRDRSDGPAAVAQKRRLWLPRPFWQRGPRSDANVAVDDNDDDDDEEKEEEEGEMDAGIGGSEVPVVAMHGQGHAGGGGELDEHPGAALGLAPPPRRSPAPRDAWRSSHHHHHHYHPPPAEPARAPAGWHGASSTASPGWWGWQDQQHGRIPGEVHSPAGQLHNWHGSNVAWGTS